MSRKRRPPPVPPNVDLRDAPIPWEAFTELAMKQFGIGREEADRLIAQVRKEKGDLKH